MICHGLDAQDVLTRFHNYTNQIKNSLAPKSEEMPSRPSEETVNQNIVFQKDFDVTIKNIPIKLQYEVYSFIQSIVMIAATPLAIVAELYRAGTGQIDFYACTSYICSIPKHVVGSIFNAALSIENAVVETLGVGTGLLLWHGGEWIVRQIEGISTTVLSNNPKIRQIVYESLGITALAAISVCIPFAPIQLLALPIIMGSIYGTINNQFTVRECPEYYTMGHHYDGTNLRQHAIKTNNVWIKPIVTGCYATTSVTKIAGIVLSAIGTLPYTAKALSVPLAAALIGVTSVVALVAAHIFSIMMKNTIERDLNEYGALIDLEWSDQNRNMTWSELQDLRNQCIEQKQKELEYNPSELALFRKKLDLLTENIEANILDESLPVKFIAPWQANNTRNGIGYIFAGGGTLAMLVSTVFLRIFVF